MTCTQRDSVQQIDRPFERYWISKHLDYYSVDTAIGGGKTIYGSAFLLRLDSNGQATSLGADFYWKNDSLYQGGEPGMTVKTGSWHRSDQTLALKQALVVKTIMRAGDRIGQLELDTIYIEANGLFLRKSDTLVPVTKPSTELQSFHKTIIDFNGPKPAVNTALSPALVALNLK